ncbi:MAG: hypothetical protein ACJAQT_002258 [Akkermansiaceae bacterium]|jgi:hypothetical protein
MRPPDFPLSYCRPGIYGFLVLAFAPAVFAQSPPTLLVRQGDTWNYRKGTSEPPADWTTVAEASLDGTWQGGIGGFGYGDDDDPTILDDMEDGYESRRTSTGRRKRLGRIIAHRERRDAHRPTC